MGVAECAVVTRRDEHQEQRLVPTRCAAFCEPSCPSTCCPRPLSCSNGCR
jgi:hypothetical protein